MRDFIHRICVVLMASACLVQDGCDRSTQSNAGTDSAGQSGDLAAERAAFKTHLLKRGPAPDLQTAYRPTWLDAQDADDVVYPSGDLKLHAWLSKDPKDGKRHPAVIFLHGNFIFEPRQWTATEPFRDAGMIAMTPMVRGENGNPGDFETFYSEVDDVIAAGNYLASLPYVDPARVYVTGHSVGGTLTMLVAEMPSPFAAAAAYSGTPDMQTWMLDYNKANCPFDSLDAREMRLRSALPNVASLRCPLYLFDGTEEDWAIPKTKQLEAAALAAGKKCELSPIIQAKGHHGQRANAAFQSTTKVSCKNPPMWQCCQLSAPGTSTMPLRTALFSLGSGRSCNILCASDDDALNL